jgi:hypothetical protein
VGLKARLDDVEKRKILTLAGHELRTLHHTAASRYTGSLVNKDSRILTEHIKYQNDQFWTQVTPTPTKTNQIMVSQAGYEGTFNNPHLVVNVAPRAQ